MQAYLNLLADIRESGIDRGDRTGTGTRSVFGRQLRFDLQDGFPILTTKRVHFKSVVNELIWFLSGDTKPSGCGRTGSAYGTSGPPRRESWGLSMVHSGTLGQPAMAAALIR